MKLQGIMVGMALLLGACQTNQMKIEGEIGGNLSDRIYLKEVVNELYGVYRTIDSSEINSGKFSFVLDSIKPQLFFLGFNNQEGGLIFTGDGTTSVKFNAIKDGRIVWDVKGSVWNDYYLTYMKEKYDIRNQQAIDSLDSLFYAARSINDTREMSRIKTISMPYYRKAEQAEKQLDERWINEHKEDVFGIYLYYNKVFMRKTFKTLDDVDVERNFLKSFGQQALFSAYKDKIDKRLALYAGCAVGAVAPEIVGIDTLGHPIKLSDFRGKYVIVDFWNSYCHWCRKESPWLQRALVAFQDKNFTILGVSNDAKQELWLKAIADDNSRWNQLLVPRGSKVMDTYCIKAIPHIVLVGPDGKILAKEIRHEELVEVPRKFMEQ